MRIKKRGDFILNLISIGRMFFVLIMLLCHVRIGFSAFENKNLASAKIISQGGAYSGCADDIDCLYDNVAGLGIIKKNMLLLNYANLYWGMDYEGISQFAGAGNYNIETLGNIGISFYKLFTERYSENYITIALGRKIKSDLSVGLSCNYLYWNSSPVQWYDMGTVEEDLQGSAISIDMGAIYQLLDEFSIGLCLQNINQPDINSGSSQVAEKVDYTAKLGFYYHDFGWRLMIDLLFKGYSLKTKNIDNRVSEKQIGVERAFIRDLLMARFGVNFYHITESLNLSTGLGLNMQKFLSYSLIVDYAFVLPINTVQGTYGSHYLAVKYHF